MYWFILLIAVLSGIVVFYYVFYEKEINNRVLEVLAICFILSALSSYLNFSRFDEVSINDYESVVNNKDKCIKYSSCEKELRNILEDGKIKEYEFSSYKEILEDEIKKDKEYEDWKAKLDRDMKNKEKLEQIKKELELKKGN